MSSRNYCITMLFIVWSASVLAQEKPLQVSIRKEWDGARTSSPLSLRLYLKWKRAELLEGRAQVEAYVDQHSISRWLSPETALSESEQVFWFMSPRPVLLEKYNRYVLESRFLSAKHSIEPEQLDVDVPIRGKRVMVIGILTDNRMQSPTGLGTKFSPTAFETPFLLQQYLDQEEVSELQVVLSRCTTKEFPHEPLRLLGLDALLVSHDILNLLREPQREAIQKWVLSGGALVLIRTGALQPEAQSWIMSLTRDEWTSQQKLRKTIPADCQVYNPGLGQLIVVPREIAGDSSDWKQIVFQAMRLKAEPIAQLNQLGRLSLRSGHRMRNSREFTTSELEGVTALEPRPRVDAVKLTELLMPESIRGMPFRVAATVLLACLLCIGPGDYFLLGLIRRRRWTWGVFPLVALGYTGWMAHLAAEHNGRNDARNWVSVVDLSTSHEVLRTSRIELTYGASGRTVTHDVKSQWWTDLRQEDFASPRLEVVDQFPGPMKWGRGAVDTPPSAISDQSERLNYVGKVPERHLVEEPVRQWSPRLQRVTTLGADPALQEYSLPTLKWDDVPVEHTEATSRYLRDHLPNEWQGAHWRVRGPDSDSGWRPLAAETPKSTRLVDVLETTSRLLWEEHQNTNHPGVFALVTELSPTAAPDCEDLVISSRPTLVLVNPVESGKYLVLRVVLLPTIEN